MNTKAIRQLADVTLDKYSSSIPRKAFEEFVKDMEASFKHKFASKPQVIEGNMKALKRAMEEVLEG